MRLRRCSICKQEFPPTTEHFYLVNPKKGDGRLRAACKACYRASKGKRRQKKPPMTTLPKLVVINKTTGTYALYEPVQHVPARSIRAAEASARFFEYRGFIVIEKSDVEL